MNIIRLLKRVLIAACLVVSSLSYAQDIHFSQFMSTPLLVNPSMTGLHDANLRVSSNYKNQWNSVFKNCFKTYAVSVDGALLKDKLYGGLFVYNDKAGDSKMGITTVNISLGSKVNINDDNILAAGIQSGWGQRRIDFSGVTWDNQFNGKSFDNNMSSGERFNNATRSLFDLSAGIYWKSILSKDLSINLGVAGAHLNKPIYSFFGDETLKNKWTLLGGAEYKPGASKISYIPSFMILKQGVTNEINLGMIAKYSLGSTDKSKGASGATSLSVGIFGRLRDAFIVYAGLNYKNTYMMGISYDINLSKLRTASYARGGAEISLTYLLRKKQAPVVSKFF